MASSLLSPASAGVYTALNVAGLQALAPGGIYDDPPQVPTYPFVFYEVREIDMRGLGTGGLPQVELRVSAVSAYEGLREAQLIIAKVIELLRDQPLTMTGYEQAGRVFYDETVRLSDEERNGVKVHELVAKFRIYGVEQ